MAKKNIRKLSSSLRTQLSRLKGHDIVAGVSMTFTPRELRSAKLKHLGVRLTSGGLKLPEEIVPPDYMGKYSHQNRHGLIVVRKDLPKETHYNAVDTPNWGDSYYGTHSVYLPYEKYPRDYYGPQLASIRMSSPNRDAGQQSYVLVFEVNRVLNQKKRTFKADLLTALNLLQENVGKCGIQKSGAKLEDYLKTLTVNWEVLPPGTREEAVQRLFHGRKPSREERATVEERYDFLMGLHPSSLVYGMSGIQRYFGALLETNLVVFENIEYGNAIYIMFENWKDLSKRSRTELLSGRFGRNFERIPHASSWKNRVKATIKAARGAQKGRT